MLPGDKGTEQSTLGSMISDPEIAVEVLETLTEHDFFYPDHKEVFKALKCLHDSGHPIDVGLLHEDLKDKHSAAGTLLMKLMKAHYFTFHIESYCRKLKKLRQNRELIKKAQQVIELATENSEEVNEVAQQAFNVATEEMGGPRKLSECSGEYILTLENRIDGTEQKLQTGFSDLDKALTGIYPGDYFIIAGRPSMGKSAFAQQITDTIALKGTPTLLISLEMPEQKLLERTISREAKIDSHDLRVGKEVDISKISNVISRVQKSPLYIDDQSGTMTEIKSSIRKAVKKYGVELVVIDYIGLISHRISGRKRYEELGDISSQFRRLTRELGVAGMMLSQLSRACDARDNSRPRLSDLRESGDLEQDADVVLFLYRDEYYNQDSEDKGVAEVRIAKQRNGPTGTVKLNFQKQIFKFANIERYRRETHYAGPQ